MRTNLNVTGKPAQFGRGVMAEVGGKLIGIFADNLASMLAADSAGSLPVPTRPMRRRTRTPACPRTRRRIRTRRCPSTC